MKDCCCPTLKIRPTTVAVTPGSNILYTFSALLNTDIGTCYIVILQDIAANHTGREEIIFNIGGTAFPVVDNWGEYITSDMLHNPRKQCPADCNFFRIQLVANGATPAVAVRRGLSCRRNNFALSVPPTP
jgi:hypothetical protein